LVKITALSSPLGAMTTIIDQGLGTGFCTYYNVVG